MALWMVFMGCGFTSRGQESGSAMCKIQASKRYIKSLPLVPNKIKEAASLKVKGLLHSCLLIMHLPSGSRMLN